MSQALPFDGPSANAGSEPQPGAELTCPVCRRVCKSKLGLAAHVRAHEREQPGDIDVKKAPGPARPGLKEVEADLGKNLKTVGEALHGLLYGLKVMYVTSPDARFRIPKTRIDLPLPAFDTHLPLTVISRSELTARLLCEHAAENDTLLRWLVRFNSWFEGGETSALIGGYVVAALGTVGIQGGLVGTGQGMLIRDVLEEVQSENYKLRRQLEEMVRQQGAPVAAGPWVDERGAGN